MRVIVLDSDNKIIGLKQVLDGYVLKGNEKISATGELGQVALDDDSFFTPDAAPVETNESLESKINRLETQLQQDNLMQFEVLATIYEELLMKG